MKIQQCIDILQEIENLDACIVDEMDDKYSITDKDELHYARFLLDEEVGTSFYNLQKAFEKAKSIYEMEVYQ